MLEFFLNRPYSLPRKGSLLKAVDAIVSKDNDWKVEERMNWLKEQALLSEGRAEGAETKALEIARKMILRGESLESIVEVVDLSLEKVAQLRNELTPSGV